MADIASFQPGTWNGKEHTADFVKKLVENFGKYSEGPNPYYQPYVSINHKDELAAGYVSAARLRNGAILSLDADELPEQVGKLRAAGAIRSPSIEYFEPVRDESGKIVDGFRKPDGTIEEGPVLKCLTLLGNDAPASKGLGALPYAKFSHAKSLPQLKRQSARTLSGVLKFSNGSVPMDRAAMLQALQAAGMDVSGITDAVPDEAIKAMLDFAQKLQAAPVAAAPDTPAPQMADGGAGGVVAAPAPVAGGGGIPGLPTQQPSVVTMKFADQLKARGVAAATADTLGSALDGIFAVQQAEVATLRGQVAAAQRTLVVVNTAANQQAHAAKFADVAAFVKTLCTPDATGMVRVQPAQRQQITDALMRCDNATVRKFADGMTCNELEREKKRYLDTLPKFKFSEKIQDPGATGAGGKPQGGGIDPDRRVRMLSATPQGRAILEKEKAAGAKK